MLFLLATLSLLNLSLGQVQFPMPSPNGNITGTLSLTEEGIPQYQVRLGDELVIPASRLGFLLEGEAPGSIMYKDWEMVGLLPHYDSNRASWRPIWGEFAEVENHFNQITLRLQHTEPRRLLHLHLRVYDIGVAIQYEFPSQTEWTGATIKEEFTEFKLTGDHDAWWMAGDYDASHYNYGTTKLSEIDNSFNCTIEDTVSSTTFSTNGVQTPLTMRTADGIYINIHEAGGSPFSGLNLEVDPSNLTLRAHLTTDVAGTKGKFEVPINTPWRTIMISRDPRAILESYMIYNLNNPMGGMESDWSWVKPQKSLGVWWEMITGNKTWRFTDELDTVEIGVTDYTQVAPNQRHGATTERVKKYIDFAAANHFDSVLIEGWNEGWEDWYGSDKETVFSYTKAYPDFDQDAVSNYAQTRGVDLILHHETGGAISDYELNLDSALTYGQQYNYSTVKVGYLGNIRFPEAHHTSQSTIKQLRNLVERAAGKQLSINMHGGLKPMGLSRTYPNLLTATAGRTNERAIAGILPSHATIVPFNHLIGGPIDFCPGLVKFDLENGVHVGGTISHQMALFVIFYSPFVLAADTIENYSAISISSDLLEFIVKIPRTWATTKYLEAEPGSYVTVSRLAPNGQDWYVAGVSAVENHTVTLKLDFLNDNVTYQLKCISDGPDAPISGTDAIVENAVVTKGKIISFPVAQGGGFVLSLTQF